MVYHVTAKMMVSLAGRPLIGYLCIYMTSILKVLFFSSSLLHESGEK